MLRFQKQILLLQDKCAVLEMSHSVLQNRSILQ